MDNILYIITQQIRVRVLSWLPWINELDVPLCWPAEDCKGAQIYSEPTSKFAALPVIRAKSIFSKKNGLSFRWKVGAGREAYQGEKGAISSSNPGPLSRRVPEYLAKVGSWKDKHWAPIACVLDH